MIAGVSRHAPGTLGYIVDQGVQRLIAAGVETARLDARVLAARYLGRAPEFVLTHPETSVREADRDAIELLLARREKREPLSQILGEREFWSMTFTVNRAVLTPRPETETVVETAIDWARTNAAESGGPLRVLDIGTGTGCLLLAVLSELPAAAGIGTDISAEALATAKENAARLGFAGRTEFKRADWAAEIDGVFDLIVSNPPYIADREQADLPPEVRNFDPPEALFAGTDGLDAYRAIAPEAARLLKPGGALVFELGQGQGDGVAAIMAESRFKESCRRPDLAGIERAILALRATA